jgi:hypothetical protein
MTNPEEEGIWCTFDEVVLSTLRQLTDQGHPHSRETYQLISNFLNYNDNGDRVRCPDGSLAPWVTIELVEEVINQL